MCEMVEYASMRFRLVCAMATRLPSAIEATARITSIACQSGAMPCSPLARSRITKANAAILGAPPMMIVVGVAAPWYTSGIHMWKGALPSLKAMPATANTRPSTRSSGARAWPVSIACATWVSSSDPVAP